MVLQRSYPRKMVGVFYAVFLISCGTSQRGGLFGKKSPHEKYADALESAGLEATAMGKLWFASADKSLAQPLTISLPYKETGYFAPEKPAAAGYRFTARTGEKLLIKIMATPSSGVALFTELWQAGIEKDKHKLLESVDTLSRQLEYEVNKETDFLVRLQPELLKGIEYTLTITTQPSLAFPVSSSGNPRVISTWGVDRDAGARRHEGVDIAATFRTPALAAAEGRIVRVNENNLGGKVVFLSPKDKNYSLYYAHLDSQLVSPGQLVKQGDVLGLVGNTGNARTTPPHLHFGIYTAGGAIDPFPFINPDEVIIPPVTASLSELNQFVRNRSVVSLYAENSERVKAIEKLEAGTLLQVLSASGNWYKVQLPDEREGFVDSDAITRTAIREFTLKQRIRLLDAPDSIAAVQIILQPGKSVVVLGRFKSYLFIRHAEKTGWIKEELN